MALRKLHLSGHVLNVLLCKMLDPQTGAAAPVQARQQQQARPTSTAASGLWAASSIFLAATPFGGVGLLAKTLSEANRRRQRDAGTGADADADGSGTSTGNMLIWPVLIQFVLSAVIMATSLFAVVIHFAAGMAWKMSFLIGLAGTLVTAGFFYPIAKPWVMQNWEAMKKVLD